MRKQMYFTLIYFVALFALCFFVYMYSWDEGIIKNELQEDYFASLEAYLDVVDEINTLLGKEAFNIDSRCLHVLNNPSIGKSAIQVELSKSPYIVGIILETDTIRKKIYTSKNESHAMLEAFYTEVKEMTYQKFKKRLFSNYYYTASGSANSKDRNYLFYKFSEDSNFVAPSAICIIDYKSFGKYLEQEFRNSMNYNKVLREHDIYRKGESEFFFTVVDINDNTVFDYNKAFDSPDIRTSDIAEFTGWKLNIFLVQISIQKEAYEEVLKRHEKDNLNRKMIVIVLLIYLTGYVIVSNYMLLKK